MTIFLLRGLYEPSFKFTFGCGTLLCIYLILRLNLFYLLDLLWLIRQLAPNISSYLTGLCLVASLSGYVRFRAFCILDQIFFIWVCQSVLRSAILTITRCFLVSRIRISHHFWSLVFLLGINVFKVIRPIDSCPRAVVTGLWHIHVHCNELSSVVSLR